MLSPWSGDQQNACLGIKEGSISFQPQVSPPSKSHLSFTAESGRKMNMNGVIMKDWWLFVQKTRWCFTTVHFIRAVRAVLSEVTHFDLRNALSICKTRKLPIRAAVGLHRGGCGGHCRGGDICCGKLSWNEVEEVFTRSEENTNKIFYSVRSWQYTFIWDTIEERKVINGDVTVEIISNGSFNQNLATKQSEIKHKKHFRLIIQGWVAPAAASQKVTITLLYLNTVGVIGDLIHIGSFEKVHFKQVSLTLQL